MRKAFDANVPKLKPRLKAGTAGSAVLPPGGLADPGAAADPAATATSTATTTPTATSISIPISTPTATSTPAASPVPDAADRPIPPPHRTGGAEGYGEGAPAAGDVLSRKDRLDKIKRRVAEAARPAPRVDPAPADPAHAAASVLGLVRDLEAELARSREREDALRADLDDVRKELSRVATEARGSAEGRAAAEKELEEKRGVLAEMLGEMQALEDERDESVRRAQALAALDEERAKLLEDVSRRADEEARLRAERDAEVERLGEELRSAASDGARLRSAVGELARERDQLAADLDRARAERDDLAGAKGALEKVHAALAQARARLG